MQGKQLFAMRRAKTALSHAFRRRKQKRQEADVDRGALDKTRTFFIVRYVSIPLNLAK